MNTTEELISNRSSQSDCNNPKTGLEAYACFYFGIHGYVSLAICCFGVPTNIVNIIILTRKSMRTPINCILTGIAVSDVLTMLSYIPYSIHFYIIHGVERTPEKYTYGWVWFLVLHACFSVTTHTISIWLGVCMSIVRYVFIRSKGMGNKNLDIPRVCGLVVLIYALVITAYIPVYTLTKVEVITYNGSNKTHYKIRNLNLGLEDMSLLEATATWIHCLLGKIVPCILISLFGGLLLHTLHVSKKRTKTLKGASLQERMRQHKRTTAMLLAIILMFIIAELPQSILIVIGLTTKGFFLNEYLLLADTTDALALINNAANFVMYCCMSRQFRDCLVEIACDGADQRNGKLTYTAVRSAHTGQTHIIDDKVHINR